MTKYWYHISIGIFNIAYWIYSLFNKKARLRLSGLRAQKLPIFSDIKPVLFHCASAGEYEQIASLIKYWSTQDKDFFPLVSFFSPSGIAWFKAKKISTACLYLPFDYQKDMTEFLKTLDPKALVIVKNELWFNLFNAAEKLSIPHFLVSAAFKKDHFALRFSYFRKRLNQFNRIFVLDKESMSHSNHALTNTELLGDTRIARIIENSRKDELPSLFHKEFDKPIIIYASVHKSDLHILQEIKQLGSDYYHIIVPHEVDKEEIDFFRNSLKFNHAILSEIDSWSGQVLIVDEIGILSQLYKISQFSYIGGGFDRGIHNILEAAIHENIVFCGPNSKHFQEARYFSEKNALIILSQTMSFAEALRSLTEEQRSTIVNEYRAFFEQNSQIIEQLYSKIEKELSGYR